MVVLPFTLLGLISQAVKLGTQASPAYRTFCLEELKEATNNFDSLSFMGEGSRGKVLSSSYYKV